MHTILYIWKEPYPWDVRVEKICKSLAKNNFKVYILARWALGQKEIEEFSDFTVIRCGYNKRSILSTPLSFNPIWKLAIKKTIEFCKPDLIIVREIMLAMAAAKQAKMKHIPCIMDMAENYPAAMKLWKKYNSNLISKILVNYFDIPELVEKESIKLIDGIITVCFEQNLRLFNEYNYNIEKITVVHNTPNLELFQKDAKKEKNEYISFCHHGHLTSEKNLDLLIYAFGIALKERSGLRLLIAGDGDCKDDYIRLVKELDIENNIKFTGKYNFDELCDIMNQIDFGIIPYSVNNFNNYTIHNKIFDYWAFGKPVIVTNNLPSSRIVKEFDSGIVCEDNPESIAKAILQIVNMNYETLSSSALIASETKYNWEIDSKNLISFINKYL